MGLLSKAAAKTSPNPDETVPDKKGISPKTSPGPEKPPPSGAEKFRGIKNDIIQYQKEKQAPFQGIVFDVPAPSGEGGDKKFLDRLSDMILCFGVAIGLPAGRSLVLLPASLDRELVAHRISHSLNTPSLGSFKALDPEGAMKELQPFL
ncbi:MAG: hypothetical protein LBP43_04645 [Treponema sp.]|jgi:hypothetical protein|nr:hypothetical protein [Treponema sp.]